MKLWIILLNILTRKEIKSEPLQTSTVDSVLKAAASLFQSKIIVFHSDSGSFEFKVIPSVDPGEDNPRFQSLKFKLERISKYDDLLTDHQGNISPYSGRGHLLLGSSKYYSNSIATHITDLYSILNPY